MKTYSHARRQALDRAAAALEPTFELTAGESSSESGTTVAEVTSQSASQSAGDDAVTGEIVEESGSSGWTRAETKEPKASRVEAWRQAEDHE
jgi:hypothetical protein